MSECVFTPVRGSRSCRGCPYSADPDLSDPGCLLPPDLYRQAVRGEKVVVTAEVEREIAERIIRHREHR
jgi:hypothetical protein